MSNAFTGGSPLVITSKLHLLIMYSILRNDFPKECGFRERDSKIFQTKKRFYLRPNQGFGIAQIHACIQIIQHSFFFSFLT